MALRINTNLLSFSSVNGQQVPPEGPRVVPIILDFSMTGEYDLNMQNVQARDYLSMVQALYLDNSNGNTPLIVSFPASGMKIQIAPNRQGYFQALCPNPALINFLSDSGAILKCALLNFPISAAQWPCITGA